MIYSGYYTFPKKHTRPFLNDSRAYAIHQPKYPKTAKNLGCSHPPLEDKTPKIQRQFFKNARKRESEENPKRRPVRKTCTVRTFPSPLYPPPIKVNLKDKVPCTRELLPGQRKTAWNLRPPPTCQENLYGVLHPKNPMTTPTAKMTCQENLVPLLRAEEPRRTRIRSSASQNRQTLLLPVNLHPLYRQLRASTSTDTLHTPTAPPGEEREPTKTGFTLPGDTDSPGNPSSLPVNTFTTYSTTLMLSISAQKPSRKL